MGYIDAERLKAEIEKGTPDKVVLLVYRDIILSLIDFLQQEQPEVDLEKEFEIYLDGMNMYVSSDDGKVKRYNGDCVDREGDYFRVFKAGFDLGLNARNKE